MDKKSVNEISNIDINKLIEYESDDETFNFDDNDIVFSFDDVDNSYIDELYKMELLWRMVGSGGSNTFYILKKDKKKNYEDAISLFDLKKSMFDNNPQSSHSDIFLNFMFNNVMSGNDITEDYLEYLKKRKAATLLTRKIAQLAKSDKIFQKKIDYICISPLAQQHYIDYADHWDLKYTNPLFCHDKDIQDILYNATIVYSTSKDFQYPTVNTSKVLKITC